MSSRTESTEAQAEHVANLADVVAHWEREERTIARRLDRAQRALLNARNALAAAEARARA